MGGRVRPCSSRSEKVERESGEAARPACEQDLRPSVGARRGHDQFLILPREEMVLRGLPPFLPFSRAARALIPDLTAPPIWPPSRPSPAACGFFRFMRDVRST